MCPAVQRVRSVFAPVAQLSFSAARLDECRAFLELRSADTECVPVVDSRQLEMAADGTLVETGYRFNPIGFSAVANALMPGLSGVFNDLSGESHNRHAASSESGELSAAISIYNTALHSRMESVRERVLILNHREKTIDGCLSIDYKMLDNTLFFNNIADEMQHEQPTANFYRAELVGRELRVYYIDPASRRSDICGDPQHVFAAGWYFSNKEDAGIALRAAPCLFTKFGVAVDGRQRQAHIRHIGADFFGRATLLIRHAAQKDIDMAVVEKAISRLCSTTLTFSDERIAFSSALLRWVNYLVSFRIGREVAKQICKNAAYVGADVSPRHVLESSSKETLASRTMYDLFCSTLRYSKSQYHTTRDLLQSVAMQMLFPSTQNDRS